MNPQDSSRGPVSPWWRYPIVWLALGGPLVVVIASIATLVIAITHPDPVLPVHANAPDAQPAVQARNHAAAPR
jgi:hypothetical protein